VSQTGGVPIGLADRKPTILTVLLGDAEDLIILLQQVLEILHRRGTRPSRPFPKSRLERLVKCPLGVEDFHGGD